MAVLLLARVVAFLASSWPAAAMPMAFPAPAASASYSSRHCSIQSHRNMSGALARTGLPKRSGPGTKPARRRRAFTKLTMESSQETKVVIVGGGIAGASVAYHLTRLGWKD